MLSPDIRYILCLVALKMSWKHKSISLSFFALCVFLMSTFEKKVYDFIQHLFTKTLRSSYACTCALSILSTCV